VRRLAAATLAVLALAGCGSSSSAAAGSTATTRPPTTEHDAGFGEGPATGPCTSLPPAPSPAVVLSWVPADLPLPPGTYATADLGAGGPTATHRGTLVVPGTPADFVRFAVASWPAKGWQIGRGDAEAGEAEDTFSRAGVRGHFRVRSAYCGGDRTELLLQLVTA
jgi:hypothetical protein